jgi:hypothetical protein
MLDVITFGRLRQLEKRVDTLDPAASHAIYGASWNKGESPALTRINSAVGMVAGVGVDGTVTRNDFDTAPIFGEFTQVTDALGNVFIRIPKFYVRKTDGAAYKTWQVSRWKHPGFYLPWCFWDFANSQEIDYVDIGKYKASLAAGDKLASVAGVYPLINKNIVEFRGYAQANGQGYQQMDIHAHDALLTLMYIEFATLDLQSVMQGYTAGQYITTHLAILTENGVNRVVLPNAQADLYRVGQSISVGTSQGGNQVFYGRTITAIEVVDAANKALVFDGAAVNIAAGNMVYNSGYKTGFSSGIAASSGSIVANDGKYPCSYRGIESPWGDIFDWVDGVNINEHQAWVAKNAADYASNLFASPYEQLAYVNGAADGHASAMGYDSALPFASLPVSVVGGASTKYYSDYYYQSTGQRVARVGGSWSGGASAGPSFWTLYDASSSASVIIGGRLVRKAVSA